METNYVFRCRVTLYSEYLCRLTMYYVCEYLWRQTMYSEYLGRQTMYLEYLRRQTMYSEYLWSETHLKLTDTKCFEEQLTLTDLTVVTDGRTYGQSINL